MNKFDYKMHLSSEELKKYKFFSLINKNVSQKELLLRLILVEDSYNKLILKVISNCEKIIISFNQKIIFRIHYQIKKFWKFEI